MHSDNGEVISGFRDNDGLRAGGDHQQRRDRLHAAARHADPADGTPRRSRTSGCGARSAYAYDQPTVNETIGQGVFPIANGPFAPGTVGHLDDTGYPQAQDMDKAQELIADYKAENPGPLNLSLATTQDETNLTIAQFQKQWWEEAGVDNVTHRPDRPGQLHPHRPAR